MKIFKQILMWIMNILSIPLAIIATTGAVWYILPLARGLQVYDYIDKYIPVQARFWITVGCGFLFIVFTVLELIFNRDSSSKVRNFFLHTTTWSICVVATVFAIWSFAVNTITTTGIEIIIGVDFVFLLLFQIFGGKLSKVINRKIQAYENSKEMNVVGRSSILWVNFLKLFEILFPEMLLLLLLCLMLSWDVAGYFTVLLIAFVVPMIGNIFCDFNARREIEKQNQASHQKLVNDVADKIKVK